MSIATVYQKCKRHAVIYWMALPTIPSRVPRDGMVVLLFIAIAFAGFGLGFVAGENHLFSGKAIQIELSPAKTVQNAKGGGEGASILSAQTSLRAVSVNDSVKTIVASKNGGRYYLISCAGAKRIHKENKIWFSSSGAAMAKGYTPAKHCFGH